MTTQASQPKRYSLLESLTNVSVGFVVGVVSNIVVLPLFGLTVSTKDSVIIAVIFTGISIARSYTLRRAFNWWHVKMYE